MRFTAPSVDSKMTPERIKRASIQHVQVINGRQTWIQVNN